MRDSNQYHSCCRTNQTLVGWLAALLLLSPLTVQMANGQVSVTITILINSIVDEPLEPTGGPVDPPAPPADVPTIELAPNEPPTNEPTASDPAASDPAASDPAASEPAASKPAASEPAPELAEPAVEQTAEITSIPEPLEVSNQEPAAGDSVGKEPEGNDTVAGDAAPPVTPNPPLEQQLSVGPVKSLLPEDRPNWISFEADYSSDTHRFVVSSIPTVRESDVDANLDAPLEEALINYVNEQFGDQRAGELLRARLSSAFIHTNLVDSKLSYTAELSTTSGGMFQKWVMVDVTKEQREQLQTWYRERIQQERLVPLGLGVAGVLGVVGFLNLVLRKRAGKSQSQPQPLMQAVGLEALANKSSCCSKKGRLGFVVAIAVAIAAAIMAG